MQSTFIVLEMQTSSITFDRSCELNSLHSCGVSHVTLRGSGQGQSLSHQVRQASPAAPQLLPPLKLLFCSPIQCSTPPHVCLHEAAEAILPERPPAKERLRQLVARVLSDRGTYLEPLLIFLCV
jgi:hypothetical protein